MPNDLTKDLRAENLDRFGLDFRKLERLRPRELTDAQRGRLMRVKPELMAAPLQLTPGKPRLTANRFLSFFSAMAVLSEPEPNEMAIFSSAFQGAVFPSVQVEFNPIKKTKAHLVEFYVTLNDPSKTYNFRVFQYPLATFQDISLTKSQPLTVVIQPIPDFSGNLGASIQQRNDPDDNAGWLFHKVRISTAG
jgi:hypothetical protein